MDTQCVFWAPGHTPSAENFRPVDPTPTLVKPLYGGMWTSTYLGPEHFSSWYRWCLTESWDLTPELWLLTPHPDATIIEIDTLHDLESLHAEFGTIDNRLPGLPLFTLDWGAIVDAGIDAIHLTEQGQSSTRLTHPLNLNGWDCESTLWFQWAFTNVTHHATITQGEQPR